MIVAGYSIIGKEKNKCSLLDVNKIWFQNGTKSIERSHLAQIDPLGRRASGSGSNVKGSIVIVPLKDILLKYEKFGTLYI